MCIRDSATPACFYAHQPDRNMTYEIATDLPKAGFDFYAGSGFVKPEKKDSVNIYTLFDRAGYTICLLYTSQTCVMAFSKELKKYKDTVDCGEGMAKLLLWTYWEDLYDYWKMRSGGLARI